MTTQVLDLQYACFVVGERPLCLWDTDIIGVNLTYLNSIDPGYFEYLGQLYAQILNEQEEQGQPASREAQHAAIALRTAYSQASDRTATALPLLASTVAVRRSLVYRLKHDRQTGVLGQ
jgi:hypothetical protein